MKRKSLALIIASAMILTSVSPTGFVSYAEEAVIEEQEAGTSAAVGSGQADDFADEINVGQVTEGEDLILEDVNDGSDVSGYGLAPEDAGDDLIEEIEVIGVSDETATADAPDLAVDETEPGFVITYPEGQTQITETIAPGDSVTLTVPIKVAEGRTVTYRWCDDMMTPIEGAADSASYTTNRGGRYECYVTDDSGYGEWAYFTVTVQTGFKVNYENMTTWITIQKGEAVELSVSASVDTGMIHYQWYAGNKTSDSIITDAVSASYTTPALEENRSYYCCRVSDDYGNSEWVDFNIWIPGFVITYPEGQTLITATMAPGESVTLTVPITVAEGRSVTYEWHKEEFGGWLPTIDGANSVSYTTKYGGIYRCFVSDDLGYNECVSFTVNVQTGLTVENESTTLECSMGESVELAVSASVDTGALYYQWCKRGTGGVADEKIEGAVSSSYTTPELTGNGYYYCIVSDDHGNSKTAWFNLMVATLTISPGLDEIYVSRGESATLSVQASSSITDSLTYQWYMMDLNSGGTTALDETSSSYTIQNVNKSGYYYCSVSDGNDILHVTFRIEVESSLHLTSTTPSRIWVSPNGSATLSVKATSDTGSEITYSWYYYDSNDERIELGTEETLLLSNITENRYYCCEAKDEYDTSSIDFEVRVDSGFLVNADSNVMVQPGDSTVLTVSAYSDAGELTYRWYYYDEEAEEDIVVSTEQTLELKNIQKEKYYYCDVSDGINDKTVSYHVRLYDGGLTVAEDSYVYVDVPMGEATQLTVDASTKEGELSYQWYTEDQETWDIIKVGTDSVLTIPAVTRDQEYWCEVSNGLALITVYYEVGVRTDTGLEVTAEKTDIPVTSGGSAELSVQVTAGDDSGTVEYYWSELSPYTGIGDYYESWCGLDCEEPSLTVENVTAPRAFRCRVSDDYVTRTVYFSVYPEGASKGDFSKAQELVPGSSNSGIACILMPGQTAYFKVVPKVSGIYSARSMAVIDGVTSGYDTYGYLYDENGTLLTESDNRVLLGYGTQDFEILYNLTAGKTYYIAAGMNSQASQLGAYSVIVEYVGPAAAHTHVWDEGIVTLEPTCTEEGIRTYTCTQEGCNETYTESIDVLGHSFTNYVSNGDATCTEDGTKTAKCDRCEATDTIADPDSKLGHEYPDEWMIQTPATCTADGVRYKVCVRNDDTITEVIPATGHSFEDQEIQEIPATDTADGMKYQKCANCDEIKVLEILVRADEQEKITAAADAIEAAVKGEENAPAAAEIVKQIADIDNQALIDSDSVEMIKNLEEILTGDQEEGNPGIGTTTISWDVADMNAAQVSAVGAAVSVAAVLQDANSGIEADPEKTYYAQIAITAESQSTETTSYTFDISLHIVDGDTTVKENVELAAPIQITLPIPAAYQNTAFELYHIVDETPVLISYTLDAENQTITFSTPSLSPFVLQADPCTDGHQDPEEWTTTVAADCIHPGQETGTCPRCGKTVTRVVEPLGDAGHEWDAGTVTKAPTCAETGIKTYTCTICQKTKTETIAKTTEHTWDAGVVTKAATCAADGVKTYTCKDCGATKTEAIAKTTTHTWGRWTTVSGATVFAAESQQRSCSVCGTTEKRTYGSKLTPTISVNATSLKLKKGQSTTAFKVSGMAAGDSVKSVTSSKTKVLKVVSYSANGTIKLKAQKKTGTAKLTITLASGCTKTITVKVQSGTVKTTKISGVTKKITLKKGQKTTLEPIITPITSQQKVTYSTSNKKIAKVTSKGAITAKKAGTAKITVKSGSKKVTVTVKVTK